MKYIRTKDGIFDLSRFKFEKGDIDQSKVGSKQDCYREQHDIEYCLHRCIWVKDIIKQADTIEELCDEYVRVHKTFNNRSMVCDKELAISSSKHPKHYDVYSSIWVNGNLIKVAKMNEKGELKLL